MRPSEPIRLCAASERASVLSLIASCRLPPDGLPDHWDSTWVAVDPDQPASVTGSVALEIYGEAALLRSLATREDQRSKGLGSALFDFAMRRAVDRGVDRVALLTTTAAPFFARRGFETVPSEAMPPELQASAEFRGACPASATAMMRRLR
jgi:amino-acid N-acetyltransferase